MKMLVKMVLIWSLILLVGWHQRGWLDWLGGVALLPLMVAVAVGVKGVHDEDK